MVSVLPQVTRFKRIALDLLFPKWCLGCGREGNYICPSCARSLSRIVPPICPGCGRPQPGGLLCRECSGKKPEIDGIRSPFVFDGVMRKAIHELKYHNLRAIAPLLAIWLHDYIVSYPVPGEVLIPVPLHPKRLRERGYNQSALLARELGRLAGLPVLEGCLTRPRYAPPQARTASVNERQNNVTGAFVCRGEKLQGKRVVVIDDVATSGATLNACAAALKSAGAASVWGLVLAKEI